MTDPSPVNWKLCCSHSSPAAIKFVIQVAFGATLCAFAMIMIATGKPGENNEIYFSMLSGTVGLFLPHPTLNATPPRTEDSTVDVEPERRREEDVLMDRAGT
jgi:hypothetical protein